MRIRTMAALTLLVMLSSISVSEAVERQARDEVLNRLYSGHKVKARISEAHSGKVMLLVDGRPQPIFWASLTGGGEDYRKAGFNTIFFELYYPGKDVTLDAALKDWDKALLDVKNQGLFVVIYIHNSIHASVGKEPCAFDNEWREYVRTIVRRYRNMTNLVGWVFSDEVGDNLTYTDPGFRKFLKSEYDTIGTLNKVWRTSHADFGDIKLEYSRSGLGRPDESMVSAVFPYGIGPKAFDSARFKVAHVAWAHERFAEAVRSVDKETPLWSGAHNLTWASTAVPEKWGIFFDSYPGYSGDDWDTHHVWNMDIGRGSNMRASMSMLLPEHWQDPKWYLDARVLRGWMMESVIHGAAGITIWPWSMLGIDNLPGDRSTSSQRIAMCREVIDTVSASGLFEMRPTNTAAVIYQPYAEGWGNLSQVYGVMRYPSVEPLPIMEQLKYGTEHGQVDYLTRLDVGGLNLNQYGVIIAQFTPDFSKNDIAKLSRYVENGGVLFVDVGFDCMRAGKTITSMTEQSKRLFGVRGLSESKAGRGRFVATGKFAELFGGLKGGVDATDSIYEYALDVVPTTAVAALRGPGGQGLYVNRVGKGYAVFCSALGWSTWGISDPLYRRIHEALFSRRIAIEVTGSSVTSDKLHFAGDCEVAKYANGYALHNRTSADLSVQVRVDGETHRHQLLPFSVLLIKDGKELSLGTGTWPVEKGPKQP